MNKPDTPPLSALFFVSWARSEAYYVVAATFGEAVEKWQRLTGYSHQPSKVERQPFEVIT